MTTVTTSRVHTGTLVPLYRQGRDERGGERSGTGCKTASLVRLLREAEDGKGLEIDFSDALGEALGHQQETRDIEPGAKTCRQKDEGRSLPLLERVSSLGGRRRVSRVIPCPSSDEDDKVAKLHEQHPGRYKENRQSRQRFQHPRCHRGQGRQPEAAPLDGGLISMPSSVRAEKCADHSAGLAGQGQTHASKASHAHVEEEALTLVSSRGGCQNFIRTGGEHSSHSMLRQSDEGCDSSRLSSDSAAAAAAAAAAVAWVNNGNDPTDTVTDNDVLRAYIALQHGPEKKSRLRERRTQSNKDVIETGQPKHLLRLGGERDGHEGDEKAVRTTTPMDIPYARLRCGGSIPSVPTGTPARPATRNKLACAPSTAPVLAAAHHVACGTAGVATAGTDGNEAETQGRQKIVLGLSVQADGGTAKGRATAEPASEQESEARAAGASLSAREARNTDASAGAASISTTTTTQGASSPGRSSRSNRHPPFKTPSTERVNDNPLGRGGCSRRETDLSPVEPTTVKLAAGLGTWANDTVAVGRLVDDDSRRLAVERAGETQKEGEIRRALERGMGTALTTLPLSFLKDFGYLQDAQRTGLERTTTIVERLATVAQARAWAKWRNLAEPRRSEQSAKPGVALCAAVVRGHLARRLVAHMRRLIDEAASRKAERKEYLLQRRLEKVATASRTVASSLIANAAARKRERVRLLRAAVAMESLSHQVERSYISLKAREQGWREIVLYRREHAAAGAIQRWTRGALVRRRTPLDRRIRRMELNDARFAIREEVFVAHLVDHGAAVVIQKWWRTLRWRMRRLRMRYRHLLGVRATVIQRAYRRRLSRLGSKRNGRPILSGGKAAADVLSSILGGRSNDVGVGVGGGGSGGGVGGVGGGGGGGGGQSAPVRLTGTRLPSAREGFASAGVSARGALMAGVARSTVMLKTTSDRAHFAGAAAARASAAGTASTAGRLTIRLSTFAGTIGRAGATTHARARTTLKMATAPIKNLFNRKKQDAAVTVTGLIMMKVASRRLLKKKKEKEDRAAARIQNYFRARKHNTTIARRRDLFRAVCIQAMHRSTAKGQAGVIVRALGRRYVDRRRFMQTRCWVIGLQAIVRGWLGRRVAQAREAHAQRLGEERTTGLVRWNQLAHKREEEELVNGARSEDLADDLELHRTFMKYCRFGDRRNTGRMVVAKLTALCKDAGLVDKRFPVQRVEISFSRLKPKELSHLPYSSFLAALDDIAIQHADVRRLADAAAAATLEESVLVLATATPAASTSTRSVEICTVKASGDASGRRRPESGSVLASGSRAGTGRDAAHRSGTRSGESVDVGATSALGHRSAAEGGRKQGAGDRGERGAREKKKGDSERTAVSPSRPGGRSSPTAKKVGTARAAGGAVAAAAAAAASSVSAGSAAAAETVSVQGFRPDDQRLLILLQKYILVKSHAGKEACSEMAAEGRGSRDRALARLEAAAVIVQARVARGCVGRAIARRARERREVARQHAMLNWAASLLQTRFRAFAAQTRVSKMAVKRYYRCLDDLTGAEYYFDPKTGKSSWTKPKVLGKFDIPTAVVVPAGEEIMVPMCHECAEEVATEICADCDEDMLCDLCVDRLHRAGNAASHLRVSIDKCEECSFQVAVKHCKQCGDNFCVSCFAHLHRKGRLRRHTFDPLVAMCHDCGDRAQAFRCFGCEAEGRLLLCKPCLNVRHADLLPYQHDQHRVEAVGLKSMKVKRMREEKAARAKERWMKAESAAAGKRTRDKRQLAAAIKIQAVWRGYLARRRRRHLMGEHLLWKMQRLRDDQIRKKRTYKIARFLGKARLLKSDTNQEIVLKQYPRWWQSTIMDIVRPTIGWYEGAKMVREQEFFAKKTRRRGRWRVHLARLRLGGARLRLRTARSKLRKREREHATAVEVYRHARVRGGVGSETKEKLQQTSRKAKRAVKIQEEDRGKMEAKVKKAEDGLEALIGPFRLRKTVNSALKRGMLMPFPVSVQKGKANARLEKGQSMREVLKWMPYGRRVCIEPVETPPSSAKVARKSVVVVPAAVTARPRPPSHALGPFFVLGVKESQQKEQREAKDVDAVGSAAGAFSGKAAHTDLGGSKASILGQDDGGVRTTAMNSDGGGNFSEAGGGEGGGGESEEAVAAAAGGAAAASSPLLVLDRQWQLADASQCQAFAMPILPPPQKVLMIVSTGFRDSFPVQAALKAAAVGAHMHRDRLERWQVKFDDDSPMHARLERWAVGSEALSQSFMLRRRKLFDVEKGFDEEKRKVAEAVESALSMWSRLLEMADFAKSAAATGLATKQGGGGKGMIRGKLGREVVVQLFKKWVQSDDRAKVIIMHRSGKGANDPAIEVVQVVGYIKVNLDTPTPVLREFIRRFCGGWLNEHAKGDRFVMESSTGVVVRRSREGAKFTETANDMVQERVNKSTRDTEAVIFVQDEKSRTDPDAEVEPVLIPEKESLDPESTPTFDDDSSVDGEGEDRDGRSNRNGARKKSRRVKNNEEGAGSEEESEVDRESDAFSSDTGSIGSLGSDLETHEEDPLAAMERDLQDAVRDRAQTSIDR